MEQRRVMITNKHGEKLVGLLHESESKEIVVLCHGFKSNKGDIVLVNLAAALEKEGISVFRFDFAGHGESEGSSLFADLDRETDDIRTVVQHFSGENRVVSAILGSVGYRVTEKDLMNLLTTDMRESCRKISKECRVLTIHGSADKMNPVDDALEFAEVIRNHQLHIIEGADHRYTSHQTELVSAVVKFIKLALGPVFGCFSN
ncbi:hypothetical protein V6N13_095175 [Hibiscus sabdariffa]|uniref:Serine aminopeptidase S33 domain-containing protein n=1 Tax=Hibiscus sabdariffa TaxID=183260 RepID=A0ABR2PSZ7_9ROSI